MPQPPLFPPPRKKKSPWELHFENGCSEKVVESLTTVAESFFTATDTAWQGPG